jgi:hypothetical protein
VKDVKFSQCRREVHRHASGASTNIAKHQWTANLALSIAIIAFSPSCTLIFAYPLPMIGAEAEHNQVFDYSEFNMAGLAMSRKSFHTFFGMFGMSWGDTHANLLTFSKTETHCQADDGLTRRSAKRCRPACRWLSPSRAAGGIPIAHRFKLPESQ